jgi:predicted transposase YbfD/YdcC
MLKKPKEFYTEIDQLFDSEAFLESIKEGLERVKDPRVSDNQTYQLIHILVMMLCAVLAGACSIVDIYMYALAKEGLFHRVLGINKTPSYSVFWLLLTRLEPNGLQECLVGWIQSLPDETRQKIVSIDGKRLRGAERNTKIHLVSAWDSLRSLLLGQVRTAEKSNEITAIPELIDKIDLRNAIVTIDAAGCQKKIVKCIRARGGDYIIALKSNQEGLLDEAENFFSQAEAVQYEDTGCLRSSSHEKGHGREEERCVVVTNLLDWLESREDWEGLNSMIEVTNRRTVKGKTTEEKHYYISSRSLEAEEAGYIIRNHWAVENRLHWCMDVNFLEDKCLASVGHAPENLATIRRLAATLIRLKLGGVAGTARMKRMAQWNEESMLSVLTGIFSMDDVKCF